MNTLKSMRALAMCAVAVAFFLGLTAARRTRAQSEDGRPHVVNATAPVSLADGQTLRVNFLNTSGRPLEIIPCIFDADGAHIRTWDTVRLLPGQTVSFELSRAEAGRRGDGSVRVRAAAHCDGSVRKYLVASGEVIEDATGRASLFVPGLPAGFDPQPDPPAAK